jgi:transcriptional/translational regulatory protein YebC/TACO1
VPATERHVAVSIEKLHETLEENDDVQVVFSNEEIEEGVA